jgi:predicted ATPase/DNA-binding NarL/FixJ family response regulator
MPSPNNLPQQLTSFIGREQEIAEVRSLLALTRLLTLTGPGGCGKTRLALQMAASLLDFPDGVWLVELAALSDPALVVQAVASTLDVWEAPDRAGIEALTTYLRSKRSLLVLDNCEHLIAACAQLTEDLLRACPNLYILATSRESLNIAGETVYLVPSLSLPDPELVQGTDALAHYESVRLFVDRASAALPDFTLTSDNATSIAQLCNRLDGMPLAIELAAARVKILPVRQIAQRLDNSFQLLTTGSRNVLPRQQTLSATMNWSYDLLSEKEQTLFRRLSVFAGGFTLQAAEAVCASGPISQSEVLDLLSHLVDKSLVSVLDRTTNGEGRYRLLETVRQYAHQRLLDSGEIADLRRLHTLFFTLYAEQAELELHGPRQIGWLDRLAQEHDNFRAALAWCQQYSVETGLRLAGNLWWFWEIRGYFGEGRRWSEGLLAQDTTPTIARAQALYAAGLLGLRQGDTSVIPFLEESLRIYRQAGNAVGTAKALERLATAASVMGNSSRAIELFEECITIFRRIGDKPRLGWTLGTFGLHLRLRGEFARAETALEECLPLQQQAGDLRGIGYALNNLGQLARVRSDYDRAAKLLEECLNISRELGDRPTICWTLNCLGNVVRIQGDYPRAQTLFAESLKVASDIGIMRHLGQSLCFFGVLIAQRGTPDAYMDSVRLIAAAAQLQPSVWDSLDADEKADWEASIAAARASLGDQGFDAAWREGQSMTWDQAVDYALDLIKSSAPTESPAEVARLHSRPANNLAGLLTPRERQVIALLARGYSNREIAKELVITERTAGIHVSNILGKLDLSSRAQAAVFAISQGLVGAPSN